MTHINSRRHGTSQFWTNVEPQLLRKREKLVNQWPGWLKMASAGVDEGRLLPYICNSVQFCQTFLQNRSEKGQLGASVCNMSAQKGSKGPQ